MGRAAGSLLSVAAEPVTVPIYAGWQPWVRDYVHQRSTAAFFDMLTAARTWLDADRMPTFRRG